jgi:predicted transcriptional regulator
MKTTPKDEVRALLEKLPDDASLNDIQYHIYVRQKIERGLEAIQSGNVISQEEIEKRMARWLENRKHCPAKKGRSQQCKPHCWQ